MKHPTIQTASDLAYYAHSVARHQQMSIDRQQPARMGPVDGSSGASKYVHESSAARVAAGSSGTTRWMPYVWKLTTTTTKARTSSQNQQRLQSSADRPTLEAPAATFQLLRINPRAALLGRSSQIALSHYYLKYTTARGAAQADAINICPILLIDRCSFLLGTLRIRKMSSTTRLDASSPCENMADVLRCGYESDDGYIT